MNVCCLYYDEFCEFEVVLAMNQFRGNNAAVALEDRVYLSEEGQRFLPDRMIQDVNPDEIDLLIIPGGDPSHLYDNVLLREFITALHVKNKLIAGICGGVELMAKFGVLDHKKCTGDGQGIMLNDNNREIFKHATIVDEDVVRDGNSITSKGQAFVEFAIELGRVMNVFKNEQEAIDDYNWLKNIK